MEAMTPEAAPTIAPAAIKGLPPGPRMPMALQTAIWSRQAQWMLEQSRARFGDMFTIKIANEGTWVMLSDPDLVKQVFTGDPRVFHAGEGNQILRPILGDNSVLVLDEKPHRSGGAGRDPRTEHEGDAPERGHPPQPRTAVGHDSAGDRDDRPPLQDGGQRLLQVTGGARVQ